MPRECQSLYHHCATCIPCHSIHAAFHRHHFLLDCIIFAQNSSIPKMNMNTVRYCLFREPPHFDDTLNSFNPSLSSVIVVFVVLHKNLVVVFHLALIVVYLVMLTCKSPLQILLRGLYAQFGQAAPPSSILFQLIRRWSGNSESKGKNHDGC